MRKLTEQEKSNLVSGVFLVASIGGMITLGMIATKLEKKDAIKRAADIAKYKDESKDILQAIMSDLNNAKYSLSEGSKKYVFKEVLKVLQSEGVGIQKSSDIR